MPPQDSCLPSSIILHCPNNYVLTIIKNIFGIIGSNKLTLIQHDENRSVDFCEQRIFSLIYLSCSDELDLLYTVTDSAQSFSKGAELYIESQARSSDWSCGKPLSIPTNTTTRVNESIPIWAQNLQLSPTYYECIPTRLPNNENLIDICSSTLTDTITLHSGMMISPQYPTLGDAYSCSKKIQTINHKLCMGFIFDLFIEGENDAGNCDTSSLTIYDGVDSIILCGLHQPKQVLISCSDIIEFKFISTRYALGYRGFTTTLLPSSIQISAEGGTTSSG